MVTCRPVRPSWRLGSSLILCLPGSGGGDLDGHSQSELGELDGGVEDVRPPLSSRRVQRGASQQDLQRRDLIGRERDGLPDRIVVGVRQGHVQRRARGQERGGDLGEAAKLLDLLARILDAVQDLGLAGADIGRRRHVEWHIPEAIDQILCLRSSGLHAIGQLLDQGAGILRGVPDVLDEAVVPLQEVEDAPCGRLNRHRASPSPTGIDRAYRFTRSSKSIRSCVAERTWGPVSPPPPRTPAERAFSRISLTLRAFFRDASSRSVPPGTCSALAWTSAASTEASADLRGKAFIWAVASLIFLPSRAISSRTASLWMAEQAVVNSTLTSSPSSRVSYRDGRRAVCGNRLIAGSLESRRRFLSRPGAPRSRRCRGIA